MTISAAETIFLAISSVDPGDRSAFLDQRCGGDAALRRDVEALIASLDAPDEDFLDPGQIPALDMAAIDGPLQPGTRLGGFLVLHALGSGGMGVVYAAQQERPRRTVAIKVLRRGFRHPEILRRFEHEAEMLGRMQHPGIAQVYAFYPGDRATPAHLVMELVAGPTLTDYARAERLSIAGRIGLIVKLADAVQHAHERGIIHRDLKPANVLIAGGGQPKVLDFGIARATGADVQRMTMQTAHGQMMGTLAYMSPEQLRGRSADVDARSDVYALGVLSYRLVAERLPFDVSDVPWAEAVQRVLEGDATPLGVVNAELRGPLEHVIAQAMARDVPQRYQTAADLAADLRRFLDGDRTTASDSAAASLPAGYGAWSKRADGVRALAATADGRHLISGGADGAVRLWDAVNGDLVRTLLQRSRGVTALTSLPDGRIAIAWEDGRLEVVVVADLEGPLRSG